jgi:Zn-dependent peptidase ImmA (M78 family)
MDKKTLIERVFQRGAEMGLTDELALYSGLDSERLQAIRDGAQFSTTEYEQLCRAVAVDPVAMYQGKETRPQRIPARFRAAASQDSPSASDIRTLALAAEQGRILAHLVSLLNKDVPIAKYRKILGVNGTTELWREGYSIGEQARNLLRDEPGPIHEVEQLLRDLGVHVARITLSSSHVDAASVWEPQTVPVILLNQSSDQTRHPGALRATLAHELCHLLHDADADGITTRVSWGEEEETGNFDEAVEIRARAFSPAFLAPRSQVLNWASRLKTSVREDDNTFVKELALYWGLSFEGAAWHAKNCDFISHIRAEELARQPRKPQISYKDFETTQTGAPPAMFHESLPPKSTHLWEGWATEVVLAAFEEGCITAGRARELLTWD